MRKLAFLFWTFGSLFTGVTAADLTADLTADRLAVSFVDDDRISAMIADGSVSGSDCSVEVGRSNGRSCLAVHTDHEFSDVELDLLKLGFGETDFRRARFLTLEVEVPEGSWVSAIKLNFRDAKGNFGGIPEVSNAMVFHPGAWIRTTIDLQKLMPDFQVWHGSASPLSAVTRLCLNPYNADQSSPQRWNLRRVILTPDRQALRSELARASPPVQKVDALVSKPSMSRDTSLSMTFDDDRQLRRWTAWRAFEATNQAFRSGVAGNPSRAIRVRGLDHYRHIVFLPMVERMTGHTMDLHSINEIRFRMYRVPDKDDFDGIGLFIADRDWQNLLYVDRVVEQVAEGDWITVSIPVQDLQPKRVKGDAADKSDEQIWSDVSELRFDVRHDGQHKDIELWIDDFTLR